MKSEIIGTYVKLEFALRFDIAERAKSYLPYVLYFHGQYRNRNYQGVRGGGLILVQKDLKKFNSKCDVDRNLNFVQRAGVGLKFFQFQA